MSELDRIKKQAHKDAIAHRFGYTEMEPTTIEDAVDDLVTVLTALDERDREIERLRELEDAALIAEYLMDECSQHYSAGHSPPEPAEYHIEWNTQQHSPEWNPLADLLDAAKAWRKEIKEQTP